MYFVLKVLITAIIVVGISELSKRYSLMAATLASLPMTTILAFIWIYIETKDTAKISDMSYDIFWLVLPSLAFFLVFPWLLKSGLHFIPSLAISCLAMALLYAGGLYLMKYIR